MKVFNASQIREWDKYTIEHEPISSIDLMERAARACVNIILRISETNSSFIIFAGPGNNGGDGFAIARLLLEAGRLARVFHLSSPTLSTDCMVNRYQFNDIGGKITVIRNESDFPFLEKGQVIIDAIFGTGQSRSLEGIHAYTSAHINSSGLPVISIDLPSGIFSDSSSAGLPHVNASYTLSFQVPKKCFFLPENANAFGNIEILDIGLSKEFYDNENALLNTLEHKQIKSIIRPRDPYAHKGNFGEALLMAGNKGMIGDFIACSFGMFTHRSRQIILCSSFTSPGYVPVSPTRSYLYYRPKPRRADQASGENRKFYSGWSRTRFRQRDRNPQYGEVPSKNKPSSFSA